MKALMKQVGGNGRGHKKARVWNMAQFQPRRWHREQQQPAAVSPEPPQPSSPILPVPHESTNPQILPTGPDLRDLGVSAVNPSYPLSAPVEKSEQKDHFTALRGQGWSLRSISKKLGVPKSTLFDWESDAFTRRSIKVLKSFHVERLQEQHLPAFEDELVKLSTFLARIERALEKHDFESMRPEFLLRTSLQLRARLQKLRINTNPSDTLDHADVPEINCGRLFRSETISDDSEADRDSEGSHARAASVDQHASSAAHSPSSSTEEGAGGGVDSFPPSRAEHPDQLGDERGPATPSSNLRPSSPSIPTPSEVSKKSVVKSENKNPDTNKNCELSGPSSPTTSADKVGAAVRLSGPITPEQTPSPLIEGANTDHPAVMAPNTPEQPGIGAISALQNHEISFAAGFGSQAPRGRGDYVNMDALAHLGPRPLGFNQREAIGVAASKGKA